MDSLLTFLELNTTEVLLGAALFVVGFAVSTAVAAVFVIQLPAAYFLDSHPREFWVDRHPILRGLGLLAKNLFGLIVFLVGVVLSMPGVPGPGIVTILIALTLLDFPGKRRIERWVVSRPAVLRAANRLRSHFGKPPLVVHEIPAADRRHRRLPS